MKLTLRINLGKKVFYTLLATIVLLVFVFTAWAYQNDMHSGNAAIFGHSAGEINLKDKNGNIVSLQEFVDNLVISSINAKNVSLWIDGHVKNLQDAIYDGDFASNLSIEIDNNTCEWSGDQTYTTTYYCPEGKVVVGMSSPRDGRYNRVAGRNYYCCAFRIIQN